MLTMEEVAAVGNDAYYRQDQEFARRWFGKEGEMYRNAIPSTYWESMRSMAHAFFQIGATTETWHQAHQLRLQQLRAENEEALRFLRVDKKELLGVGK